MTPCGSETAEPRAGERTGGVGRGGGTLDASEDDEAAPPIRLRLEDGREHAVSGRLTIGSQADCDVVVDDPYVSGCHCVVTRHGRRTMVRDAGSRNGTFVGGIRVSVAELRGGVALTVGRTRIRVVHRPGESQAGDELLVGTSMAMREVRRCIARVAPMRAGVLLVGESGTGKELAAALIHQQSGRQGAFIAVNCASIAPEMAESELFGHERGAFTGATVRRAGYFEEADGGTLFLDEIGDLPGPMQAKLLRVLESGTVRAVGASGERSVNVRVIAATNRDLARDVGSGRFRLDLYHRLATVDVPLPPLRDRRGDIPELARHFLDRFVTETGPQKLSSDALAFLVKAPWPGNARELHNTLYRAAIFGAGVIHVEELIRHTSWVAADDGDDRSAEAQLVEMERQLMARELSRQGGSRRKAAHALGMARSTFCDKVRRYGINADEYVVE